MKELIGFAGPFAIISGLLLLLCLIFSVIYTGDKETPAYRRAIWCAIGSVAAAVIWFIQRFADYRNEATILALPVLFVGVIALVLVVRCIRTYKEEQALAEERREKMKRDSLEWENTAVRKRETRKAPVEQKSGSSNPGTLLKRIAAYGLTGEIAASVIGAFAYALRVWEENGFEFRDILIILSIVVGGCCAAYIIYLILYTIGTTCEYAEEIRTDVRKLMQNNRTDGRENT